jgi:hypothetical protein
MRRPSVNDLISPAALADYLDEIIQLLTSINQKLGSEQTTPSSVEIKTSTRGVDISTKAYANSPIREAGDAAMDEFLRVGREVEKRLMGQA